MIVRILFFVMSACAAFVPVAVQAQSQPGGAVERLTHWGKWAEFVGDTVHVYMVTPTGYAKSGTEICKWVEPGIEMLCVETYADGARETRSSLGLDNRIRSYGLTAAGHVVWDRYEDGSFGASYIGDDGTSWDMRALYQDDRQVTVWVTMNTQEFVLVGLRDEPAGSAAERIAKVADAARGMQKPAGAIASSVAASASAPLVDATQAATMQSAWGPLSALAGHDWVQHYLGNFKAQVPTRFSWAVPGRVLLAVDRYGTGVYRLAPDGTIIYRPAATLKGRSEVTLYPQAGGALMEYAPPPPDVVQYIKAADKRSRYFTYFDPNGQVSRWLHSADRPDLGVASSVFVRTDGSTGSVTEVLGAALRDPAAWGPLARLANMTVTTSGHPAFIFRVAEGGDVMHMLRKGTGLPTPEASFALGPRGTIVRRDKRTLHGRDVGSYKQGFIVDPTRVEWRAPGRSMDYFMIDHIWTIVEGEYGTTFTVSYPDGPGFAGEQQVELLRFGPELLAPALASLQETSRGIAATVQAQANEYIQRTSGNGTNEFLGAMSRALDIGNAYADAALAQSRAELDATLAMANAQAATQGASGGTSPVPSAGTDDPLPAGQSSGAVSPVTVFLWKGFQVPITPGATSNEGCFAKVQLGPVTTDPMYREGEAKQAMASAEQQFLDACRQLGQLGAGDFADEWYIDERAESTYAAMRGNRWMHEVSAW